MTYPAIENPEVGLLFSLLDELFGCFDEFCISMFYYFLV